MEIVFFAPMVVWASLLLEFTVVISQWQTEIAWRSFYDRLPGGLYGKRSNWRGIPGLGEAQDKSRAHASTHVYQDT